MSGMNAGVYRKRVFGKYYDFTPEELETKLREHYKASLKRYPQREMLLRGYARAEQYDPIQHNMKQVRQYYRQALGFKQTRRTGIKLTEEKKQKMLNGAEQFRNAWKEEKLRIVRHVSAEPINTEADVLNIWNDKNQFTPAERKRYYADFRAKWRATHKKKVYQRKPRAKAPAKKKAVKRTTTRKAPAKPRKKTTYKGFKEQRPKKSINMKKRDIALKEFLKRHKGEMKSTDLRKEFTKIWKAQKIYHGEGEGVAMI